MGDAQPVGVAGRHPVDGPVDGGRRVPAVGPQRLPEDVGDHQVDGDKILLPQGTARHRQMLPLGDVKSDVSAELTIVQADYQEWQPILVSMLDFISHRRGEGGGVAVQQQ